MHTTTRRAMLGAIAAAPVVVASMPAAAAASPVTAWDRLMAECRAAEDEYRRADSYYSPRSEAGDAKVEALCDRFCELEDRLMAMPAPHLSALRWKLDKLLVIEADRMTTSWSGRYVAQTRRDIARLLGGGAVA